MCICVGHSASLKLETGKVNTLLLAYMGCLAKVNVPVIKKFKPRPKTIYYVFNRYVAHRIGNRFLVVKSRVPDMKFGANFESKDATFFEEIFPMRDKPSMSSQEPHPKSFNPVNDYEHFNDESFAEDNNDTPLTSKRQRTSKYF